MCHVALGDNQYNNEGLSRDTPSISSKVLGGRMKKFDWNSANIKVSNTPTLLMEISVAHLQKRYPTGTQIKTTLLDSKEPLIVRDHKVVYIKFPDDSISECFAAVNVGASKWVDGHFIEKETSHERHHTPAV